MHTRTSTPDYFIAQFPGGGQRGYATVKLLEWFENETGLPTHQIFPYVTCGSVGILIASALYLPHPTQPKSALMSAAQLVKVFPDIASKTPNKAAMFKNTNDRMPFAEVVELFIGQGKLKDLLGTVFFSTHVIGAGSKSHKSHGKIIHPKTGVASFKGDPETKILDIAFAGTALPSIFPAYDGHIDLAFSEVYSDSVQSIKQLFSSEMIGAFVRVGNFRGVSKKLISRLYNDGYVLQTRAIFDAISDHAFAQTMGFARASFGKHVYNLEQEIDTTNKESPEIEANITTPAQFEKISRLMDHYISENEDMLRNLAALLKSTALKRLSLYPATGLNIPRFVQEHAIPEISQKKTTNENTLSYQFWQSAGKLTLAFLHLCQYGLKATFDIVNSSTMIRYRQAVHYHLQSALSSWEKKLLPEIKLSAEDRTPSALQNPIEPK